MRFKFGSLFTVLLLVVATMAGFATPSASAQEYPPVVPVDPGVPSEEILAVIQANSALRDVERAVAQGNLAGAEAQIDGLQALLRQARAAGFSSQVINDLAALLAKAQAIATPVSVPASPLAAQPPSLAFTGASASLPAALGASFVGAGGLLLLWSRKRTVAAQA